MADQVTTHQAGTNKYAKEFSIPVEFPDILTNLTREILRSQPDDIDKFAMEYFAKEIENQKKITSVPEVSNTENSDQ